MTSHDVVMWLRQSLRKETGSLIKVGHTGTLDPPASGILSICIGKAARLSRFIEDSRKTYVFEIVFGIATNTIDSVGTIVKRDDTTISGDALKAILPGMLGEQEQTPPDFSAVHHNGERAYKLAQQGKEFELPTRMIHIYNLELLDFRSGKNPRGLFGATCSKGTYVRSLCTKICDSLGGIGHIGFLERTQVGFFKIDDSYTLEELEEKGISSCMLDLDWPLKSMERVELEPGQAKRFCLGTAIETKIPPQKGLFRVYSSENEVFLGIGKSNEMYILPEIVTASPDTIADNA